MLKRYIVEYWEGDHSPLKGVYEPLQEVVVATTCEKALDAFWNRMSLSGGTAGVVVWTSYAQA